jgi:hypothetical protein
VEAQFLEEVVELILEVLRQFLRTERVEICLPRKKETGSD